MSSNIAKSKKTKKIVPKTEDVPVVVPVVEETKDAEDPEVLGVVEGEMGADPIIKNLKSHFEWEEGAWPVIDAYFKQDNTLIQHHLNSFNYFMSHQIYNIVREKDFVIRIYDKTSWNEEKGFHENLYEVRFGKVYMSKPVLYDAPHKPMYPNDARLRNLSYSGSLYVDIHHKYIKVDDNGDETWDEKDDFTIPQ
jgi:DNA-directed RNA polymerase II subunit RPB2